MTPEFMQQLQQGAAIVGNAAQSGDISALFAPGTLSTLDPLFDYAKTAPVLTLKGNTEYENLSFQPLPDTKYQLTVGGKSVGAASNPQEVARLVDQANAISEQGGANVDVRLQREVQAATRTGEPITAFEDIYSNKENNMGALETLIPLALSVMGGLALGPLIQGGAVAGSASALGAGLGSAAGSFAGNLAVGKSLEESLIKAAISGVTAGAIKGVMPGGGNGIGAMPDVDFAGLENIVFGGSTALPAAALEPLLTSTASTLGSTALPEIVVSAAKNAIAPAVLSGISSASGSLLGDVGKSLVQPDPFQQALDQARVLNQPALPPVEADEILALGQRVAPTIPGTEALAPITGGALTAPLSPPPPPPPPEPPAPPSVEPEIVVTNTAPPPVDLSGIGSLPISVLTPPPPPPAPPPPPPEPQSDYQPGDDAPIVVTAPPTTPPNIGGALGAATGAAAPTGGNLDYLNKVIQEEIDIDTVTGKRPITDKIITGVLGAAGLGAVANTIGASSTPATTADKIQTGLTGTGLLANAVDGDGDGGGTINPGTGYTVPSGRERVVRGTFNDDPFTYGQKSGEILFFGDGMAEGGEVDDDMVSHLIAYRRGGGHMGPGKVKGIGSGQDDKIPAWLSDGEYVWSAQDVADLGDGSTDEGVRRLDKMRQMVRKGAGRKDVKKIAKPQRGIEDMLKAVGGAV
jgi:hypothetical protein